MVRLPIVRRTTGPIATRSVVEVTDIEAKAAWTSPQSTPSHDQIVEILESTVDPIVARFAQCIGLWDN